MFWRAFSAVIIYFMLNNLCKMVLRNVMNLIIFPLIDAAKGGGGIVIQGAIS